MPYVPQQLANSQVGVCASTPVPRVLDGTNPVVVLFKHALNWQGANLIVRHVVRLSPRRRYKMDDL